MNKETRTDLPSSTVESRPLPPGRWPAPVKRWWETWASSPQSALFLATDWQRLEMLLPLVASYMRSGRKDLMAEIRLNEERWGATVADRQRLKWDAKRPEESEVEPTARRERLRVVDRNAG